MYLPVCIRLRVFLFISFLCVVFSFTFFDLHLLHIRIIYSKHVCTAVIVVFRSLIDEIHTPLAYTNTLILRL